MNKLDYNMPKKKIEKVTPNCKICVQRDKREGETFCVKAGRRGSDYYNSFGCHENFEVDKCLDCMNRPWDKEICRAQFDKPTLYAIHSCGEDLFESRTEFNEKVKENMQPKLSYWRYFDFKIENKIDWNKTRENTPFLVWDDQTEPAYKELRYFSDFNEKLGPMFFIDQLKSDEGSEVEPWENYQQILIMEEKK